jgi:hypothetical protein
MQDWYISLFIQNIFIKICFYVDKFNIIIKLNTSKEEIEIIENCET